MSHKFFSFPYSVIVFIIGVSALLACSSASELRDLLMTPTPTLTRLPTRTPAPTETPTETPLPTATYTRLPTLAPLPTSTPLPQACATSVPRTVALHGYGLTKPINFVNVVGVYFLPRDATPDPQWRDKMEAAFKLAQEFHAVQLACQSTFLYTIVAQPITSTQTITSYQQLDGLRAWRSLQSEVLSKMALPNFGYPVVIVQAQFDTKDKRSYGGTAKWGGFALMSAQLLAVNANLAAGAYYHEVAHGYGLPHTPQDPKAIMEGTIKDLTSSYLSDFQKIKLSGPISWTLIAQEMDVALKADPNDESLYQQRGDAYFQTENYTATLKDYNQWLDLNPTSPTAYFSRGNVWLAQRDYTRAIADYGRAVSLDATTQAAYTGAGLAHYQLKQYDNARAFFERALFFDSSDVNAMGGLAHTFRELKMCDRAVLWYRRALAADSNNFNVAAWRKGLADCGG
jgi:tetratricopeptide (TPR) repeat protein